MLSSQSITMPRLTGVETRVYKVPSDLYETLRTICNLYKEQPLFRAEITQRLETLSTSPTFDHPEAPNQDVLDELAKLAEQLDRIEQAATTAAAKGTRPSKARTTRKSDG